VKKILIIGATSAIAEASAKIWANRGSSLFLVARNQERLEVIQNDLRVRGASQVSIYCLDMNDFDGHLLMLEKVNQVFDGIDVVLIAHGTLSNQAQCEQSVESTIKEITTNALSVIGLLTHLANIFERQKKGVIAVISSVAGERGRQSNYVYGSAKAMVTSFTSGLRQRLAKQAVCVLTIKPGFVDTPMTANFKKGPLWASSAKVAQLLVNAIDTKRDIAYLPVFWCGIMFLIRAIPERIFKKLSL
jgi:short-subunit dehydrogenase